MLTHFQWFDYAFGIVWYLVGLTMILSGVFPALSALGIDFLYVTSPLEYLVNVIAYTFLQILFYSAPLVIVGEPIGRVFKGQTIGVIVASTYTRALIDALLGKKATFEVTPKKSKRKALKS